MKSEEVQDGGKGRGESPPFPSFQANQRENNESSHPKRTRGSVAKCAREFCYAVGMVVWY